MFSKSINHPLFKELDKGLFGYSGKLDFSRHKNVEVSIKGRSSGALEFAATELEYIEKNIGQFLTPATEDAYSAYEVIKEVVESGEYDLEADGGELPDVPSPTDVWQHMDIDSIIVEPKSKYQIRLGYRSPWDIEHDFGIYITNRKYEYSGISV